MSSSTRVQLTLFINDIYAGEIERVRVQYNPVQYSLIKSHVTLCREDELMPAEILPEVLGRLRHQPIGVQFDTPARFCNNKGVLLPAKGDNGPFNSLRKAVLSNRPGQPRKHDPHITLMHPRNSTCTNEIFAEISRLRFPAQILFNTVSLIEQTGNGPWKTLAEYQLIG
ncbi:MAG: 2'-5' RNA ligase family protein [Dinghuibacter sp.]|nr:2'-5' RNA ligase family protein [Dinghuibacter sp.]